MKAPPPAVRLPLEALGAATLGVVESLGRFGAFLGQALAMSGGSYAIFVERPIALVMLLAVLALLVLSLRDALKRSQTGWRGGG